MTAEEELHNRQHVDRQRSEKFTCVLDLTDRLRQMGGEKTGIWGGSNPALRDDLSVRQSSDDLGNLRQ